MFALLMWLQFPHFATRAPKEEQVHEEWHATAVMAADALLFAVMSARPDQLVVDAFIHGRLYQEVSYGVFTLRVRRLLEARGLSRFELTHKLEPLPDSPYKGVRLQLHLHASRSLQSERSHL